MRLFLASQDFGNYVDRLSAMVGKNRKTLVVTNARDYSVDKGVEAQKELFAANDLDFYELDLRKYFGQQEELEKFVDEYHWIKEEEMLDLLIFVLCLLLLKKARMNPIWVMLLAGAANVALSLAGL